MYCILNAKIVILSGDKIELPMNIYAGNIEVVENLFHSSVKKDKNKTTFGSLTLQPAKKMIHPLLKKFY